MFIPECYGQYGSDRSKCLKCMCDVSCTVVEPVTRFVTNPGDNQDSFKLSGVRKKSVSVKLPYSKADAAKRLVLSGCFAPERMIRDFASVYDVKYERAKTYIRGTMRDITESVAFFIKGNLKVFSAPSGVSFASTIRETVIDAGTKTFFLDTEEAISRIFETGATRLEYRSKQPKPKECTTVITDVCRLAEYAAMSRVQRIYAFGKMQEPMPKDILDLDARKPMQAWTMPLSPLYVVFWRRK